MCKMEFILISLISSSFIVLGAVSGLESLEFVLAKEQMIAELSDCTEAITGLDLDGRNPPSHTTISVQNILNTLSSLDSLVEDELAYYQGLLENLTTASIYDLDLRHTTLEQIDEVADDTLQKGQGQQGVSSCVSQQPVEEHEAANQINWRESENAGGYRRNYWAQGVYRYSRFDACADYMYIPCSLHHMLVLADGTLAVSDAQNYEIRLYNMEGVFLRKFSVLPLQPSHMTLIQGFKIFVRLRNLNKNYIIAEVDLWEMKIRTVIEWFETFPWEFACLSPLSFVNNILFVGCTPYLFMYDVNGTRLGNLTTPDEQMISFFHSEQGAERVFMSAPTITDMFPYRPTIFSAKNISNGPICSLQNDHWLVTGAMSANGTFYAVNGYDRFRVTKYGPNCESEGTFIEINNNHDIATLAVFGDLLVAQVEQKRRWRSNNMLHVFKLVG